MNIVHGPLTGHLRKATIEHGMGEVAMAWNLTGNYFETCSCELMCPCNLSFDDGANL